VIDVTPQTRLTSTAMPRDLSTSPHLALLSTGIWK